MRPFRLFCRDLEGRSLPVILLSPTSFGFSSVEEALKADFLSLCLDPKINNFF